MILPLPVNTTVRPYVSMKYGSNGKTVKANICSYIFISFPTSLLVVFLFVPAPAATLLASFVSAPPCRQIRVCISNENRILGKVLC